MASVNAATLTVTNTASETNIHSITIGYTLINPPAGMTINTNGIITWTPQQTPVPLRQFYDVFVEGSHGWIVGGSVTGGVYGRHPDIFNLDDDENTVYKQSAVTHRSTDFRDVYGTILKHWLNVPAPTILSSVLPVDGGDPDTQWTAPNFDMGFLT